MPCVCRADAYQRNRDLSDQEIFDACCSRDDTRDGIEGPVTSYYSQECVDSKWPMSKDAALPPLGLSSTPQSSWQTYTEPVTPDNPWVLRPHVPGPPDEPLTLKPYVPRIIHNIQYRPPPQRLQPYRSDHEILTNFDDDVSSTRNGFTAWVESDAAVTRSRHLANSSPSGTALVFRKASEKKSMSQLLEYQFDNRKPNRQQEHTRISILSWSSGPRRGTPVLLRNTSQVNGTLLLYKKPSSICNTSTLRPISKPSTSPGVLSYSTKTPSTQIHV